MKQNKQINAYLEQFDLKHQQLELLELIKDHNPQFNGRFLDIGCANGIFVEAANKLFPEAKFSGFDINQKLIRMASERITENNIIFFVSDIENLNPSEKYDIITASGILSIFDDYKLIIDKWLNWLDEKGRLYIFGRFNTEDIDTKIYFRNNFVGGDWESGLTSYSIQSVSKYLEKKNLKYQFKRFHLGIDLSKKQDPIRTYTVNCDNGSKMVINGANIIAEHYYLMIFLD